MSTWAPVLTFLAGAATAVFAEPLRRWIFRPVVEVAFEPDTCIVSTPTGPTATESQGYWLRVRVRTRNGLGTRLAKGCRPYLVNVEIEEKGEFRPSNFVDTLRLKWSSQVADDVTKAMDIPGDVSQFADVIATDRTAPGRFSAQTTLMPHYCCHLFDARPKALRLTILVTSDDAKPAMTHFVFRWNGAWDTFEASAN